MAYDRAFVISVGVSLLFHLSMVTVFSIVIFFPREVIDYYTFRIVEPQAQRPRRIARGERLRVPSPADAPMPDALDAPQGLDLDGDESVWGELPEIELPTLEFAELRRLRVRERGLELRARHESLLSPQPRDAWARFGRELGHLRHALSSTLRLSGGKAPAGEDYAAPVTRPAAGFEAHIEWMGEPRDRQLLFAPPIRALWGVDPATFDGPLVLEFTVNPQGRVTSAWSPQLDEAGLITDAQNSLLKYRFEPIDGGRAQQATLHITAARAGP